MNNINSLNNIGNNNKAGNNKAGNNKLGNNNKAGNNKLGNNNKAGNNKQINNINTTINNIKNKSLGNKLSKNKNLIFILVVVLFIVIVGLLSYYIYKKYPEIIPFWNNNDNEETDENKIQKGLNKLRENEALQRQQSNLENSRQRRNKINNSNMQNLLDNVKNQSYKVNTNNKKQVFNISNNIFAYDDAEAVCKSHGAELATYEQVVDAYKNGAEWCNYGWSKNQMALYPTQKKTWEKLQEDSESANNCGEWGVNGGYFENKDTLFGANCYGIKPEPKDRERTKNVPMSVRQRDIQDKIKMFKAKKNDITINPFNNDLWSQR